MAVNIKTPPVYDVSSWQIIPDWTKVSPRPALVILRATYGSATVDSTYVNYYKGAKAAGYPVWGYHFFLYNQDWLAQANAFLNTVKSAGITSDFVPVIDIEGYPASSGISVATANGMIENFLKKVEADLGRACYIYSSKNYLSQLYTITPPAWLSAPWRLLWIAGYPSDPNAYEDMPTSYLPTGVTISRVALWQYSGNGTVTGISGNSVDLSDMTDWYEIQWATTTTPVEPTLEQKVQKLWNAHPELH